MRQLETHVGIEDAQPTPDELRKKRMTLNMGPQHPSTHGVLRVMIELDGENITRATPDIGFLHTGIEKECEVKTWAQAVTLTDRGVQKADVGNGGNDRFAVQLQ